MFEHLFDYCDGMTSGLQEWATVEVDPFAGPAFRADLALVAAAARDASRRFADDAVLLARLATRVPRAPGDERGGTAWTSFVREVAVARRSSDRAAAADISIACRLVADLPCALALLGSGDLAVLRARTLVEATYGCIDRSLARVDAEVAQRACRLTPSRIRDAVDRVLLQEEADVVAARAAAAATARNVRRTALRDDQAEIVLQGPAVPLAQAYAALDADARALRAQGDGRGLDALRFDLATSRLRGDDAGGAPDRSGWERTSSAGPGSAVSNAEGIGSEASGSEASGSEATESEGPAVPLAVPPLAVPPLAAPPDAGSPTWFTDRRCSRPVRLDITVPVTTALGLSNEPGWLDGHGWISAPTCRQLLVVAELRQVCVDAVGGRVVDLAHHVVRPALDPAAVAAALHDMVTDPFDITDTLWRPVPQHDPGEALREFIVLRDGLCDGPTGARVTARRAHLDHDVAFPDGPTAAWNLAARSERTHVLKHRGWQPVRTLTSTIWFSPAGQVVDVPFHTRPIDPLEADTVLPDPVLLHAFEAELLRPPTADDAPPEW